MELFGFTIPLWAFIIIAIIGFIALWKIIKFAITLLIIVVIALLIMFGLDVLGVFQNLQSLLTSIV